MQRMKTVCVTVFSPELTHLKNCKVKMLATVFTAAAAPEGISPLG